MKLQKEIHLAAKNIGDATSTPFRANGTLMETIPLLLKWISQTSMKNHFQLFICRSVEDMENCLIRKMTDKNIDASELDFSQLIMQLAEEQESEKENLEER